MDLVVERFIRMKYSTEMLLNYLCFVPARRSGEAVPRGPFWKIDHVERWPSLEVLKPYRAWLPVFNRRTHIHKQRKYFLQSSSSHQRNDLHEFGWYQGENRVCVCVCVCVCVWERKRDRERVCTTVWHQTIVMICENKEQSGGPWHARVLLPPQIHGGQSLSSCFNMCRTKKGRSQKTNLKH